MCGGPWPDDTFGNVAAYIKEQGPEEDFRYVYALLRGTGDDLESFTPVIWGGATPDENRRRPRGRRHPVGPRSQQRVLLTAHERPTEGQGRFVAVYGTEAAEEDPNDTVTWIVSLFRNFQAPDKPNDEPGDLDYLYGPLPRHR